MRNYPVKSINITSEISKDFGLEEVKIPSAGKYTVFSGKNGSGKTRVMNLIREIMQDIINNYYYLDDPLASIDEINNIGAEISSRALHGKNLLSGDLLDLIRINRDTQVIKFDNNQRTSLEFPQKILPYEQKNIIRNFNDIGRFDSYYYQVPVYIQYLQDNWMDATHPQQSSMSEKEKNDIIKKYQYFCEIMKSSMGISIGRSSERYFLFNNIDISSFPLSPGQLKFLAHLCSFHANLNKLDSAVIFMDEPETFLHPSSMIEILENLSQIFNNVQFFIATHSLPLISYLHAKDQDSLWFVENGYVKRAGRTPEHVLKSLLGDQDRINELRSFTELPEILAQINYAVQCLAPPGVVGATTGDTQNNQIYRVLSSLKKGQPIRLLDYGAGRGRILDGLAENASGKPEEQFDYFAFDSYSNHADECKSVIGQYYRNPDERYANNLNEYIQAHPPLLGSFDIVLLCNVLHEIPPNEWVNLFKKEAPIDRLLSDNGYLLIVEDNRIPVGEKAHNFGFIVLNTAELKLLFNIPDNAGDDFVIDDAKKGRDLKAHLIHKKFLTNMNTKTVISSIKSVKSVAETEIDELRKSSARDYGKGLKNAFWVHQYTNSSLYLSSHDER